MTNINFDSNQMEKDFIELYKSGELPFEKFDEYTKSLIKTTKEMHEKEEETKQKEEETKQTISSNTAKNVEHMSEAAIEWSQTLRPVLVVALLLFEGGREIYNQMCKKPKENTDDITK